MNYNPDDSIQTKYGKSYKPTKKVDNKNWVRIFRNMIAFRNYDRRIKN